MLAKVIIPTRKTVSRIKHITLLLLISIYILNQAVLQEEDTVDDSNNQGEVENRLDHTYAVIRKNENIEAMEENNSNFSINYQLERFVV